MNITRAEKKAKAIEVMTALDIYKPYIKGFKENDQVCFFESFGGYWVFQESKIEAKMHEIEEKYDCLVYAITHEYTQFGELYDFLIITDYKEEWDELPQKKASRHYAFAYVWNKDDEWCSEFGTIEIQSAFGGVKRIG